MREILILICLITLIECSSWQKVVKTLNDVAIVTCELTAARHGKEKLGGLTPEEWCAIPKNLKPFLDQVSAANEKAGLEH